MVDTHVHFYDPSRPQGVPWPSRDNDLLYRTVLPGHFHAVAGPWGVTRAVVVEASGWVEDNQWILDLAGDEPSIVGFIGNLDPESEDYAAHLDRFARNPLFRGIRLRRAQLQKLDVPAVRAGIHALAERDLAMDLLAHADELPTVAGLAADLPGLRIVVNHVAHVPIDGRDPPPEWREGLKALAPHENVYMKVSALAEAARPQPAPSDPAFYAPTLEAMWSTLGPDRLLYGSNWPVCERAADYATVFSIVDTFFSGKGERARKKYFVDNGRRAYKWLER